jgi:hypothetical protein
MAPSTHAAPRPAAPAGLLLLGVLAVYGVLAARTLLHAPGLAEEVSALIRSWWYVAAEGGGAVRPYTAADATWSMPLYFYQLGLWQKLAGIGPLPARIMSIAVGAVDGLLLFLICKRLTANTVASAAAAFIFLATPATVFAFATATSASTIALLHLGAAWLIVTHMGRPQIWASIAMGVVCAALFFYRQDMILAVIVLAPLYVAAVGRAKRWLHAAIVTAAILVVSAAILAVFPAKLADYAARLPVVYPLIERLGGVARNFALIDGGVTGANPMLFDLGRIRFADIVEGFLLPYSGTILAGLAIFALAGRGLRILWIPALYFLWLAVAHILGTAGFCGACITGYAPAFAGIGALAAGVSLALLGRSARTHNLPSAVAIVSLAVAAVGLNAFAPMLARSAAYHAYPAARMGDASAVPERADTVALARWIAAMTPRPDPILAIHSLGKTRLPTLPWAVFLAGHLMPVQSFDLTATHRTIDPRLPAARREAVQAAIEDETLWTDDTLRRWIERDYDVIVFQHDPETDQAALLASIADRFDLAGTTRYREQDISLYKRKAAQ